MGKNLPPGVSVSDLPGNRVGEDVPLDKSQYGDEAECAVCGKPLKRPPHHPEHPDFCEDHDKEDLRKKARAEAQERDPDKQDADYRRYKRLEDE